jgi:hypothetical protein
VPIINRCRRQIRDPRSTTPSRVHRHHRRLPIEETGTGLGVSFLVSVSLSSKIVAMAAKIGRRSKGDRDAFAIRPMRPVGDRIRQNAAELGITYNDYVTGILARAVGMPEYAPPPATGSQLDLPLDERMTA